MKKTYIKPEIEVIKLDACTVMMAESVEIDIGETPSEPDAQRRRGTWGNLWEETPTDEDYI